MKGADGSKVDSAVITLATGVSVSVRLVFEDPDPADGQPAELWEGQYRKARGYGPSPVEAASAALNTFQLLRPWGMS